jgi:hypothetical protein
MRIEITRVPIIAWNDYEVKPVLFLFISKFCSFLNPEMKRVAWPPVSAEIAKTNENDNGIIGDDEVEQRHHQDASYSNRFSTTNNQQMPNGSKVAPPVPPKPGAREIANAQVSRSHGFYFTFFRLFLT